MESHYYHWFTRTSGMRKVLAALALALVFLPRDAMAHHMIGGEVPKTLIGGLLSGLAHPVIGFDHLAFILAVGLIAAVVARGRVFPVVFLGASLAGLVVHLTGVTVPGGEIIIAVTVLGAGAFLIARQNVGRLTLGIGFALAGVIHGYAYGESIVGAEPTPLVAYLVGLVLIQYAVAMGAFAAARRLSGRSLPVHAAAMRAAGVTVGLTGLVAFALAL